MTSTVYAHSLNGRSPKRLRNPQTRSEHSARILCVDDDDDLTRCIKARLRTLNVDVTRTANGREALKQAHSHRPNAIVTDLEMNRGTGEYLIRKLKNRPSTAKVPIIVVSGVDRQRLEEAWLLGADTVLRKPIGVEDVIEHVLAFLMTRRTVESRIDGSDAPGESAGGKWTITTNGAEEHMDRRLLRIDSSHSGRRIHFDPRTGF